MDDGDEGHADHTETDTDVSTRWRRGTAVTTSSLPLPRRFAPWLRWVGAWVLVVGILLVAVVPPERCGTPSEGELDNAIDGAAAWLIANQFEDDRWRYEYTRATDADSSDYNIVRHAGVMMALFQLHADEGNPAALAAADRGLEWARQQLVDANGGVALVERGRVTSGAAALLLAGLTFRHAAEGPSDDDLPRALATFLVGQVRDDGAVLAEFDLETGAPVPDLFSSFFTGEVMWALALADDTFGLPDAEAAALRVADYVALEREDAEPEFPPNDDHWAAYSLAALADEGLADHHRDYGTRLAGLWSSEVRFDAQRTGEGLNKLVRGGVDRGAQQGTNLEGLTSLWRAAVVDDGLSELRADLRDRIACGADMLARRQVTAAEAAGDAQPVATDGAWFRDGITRMDVQQHAMSGLVGARAVLAAEEAADPGPSVAAVVAGALVVFLAVDPFRRRWRAVAGRPPVVVGWAVLLSAAALAGEWALDRLDVSDTTARLALAALLGLAGLRVFVPSRPGGVVAEPGPVAVITSLIVGSTLGGWAVIAVLVALAMAYLTVVARPSLPVTRALHGLRWIALLAAIAVLATTGAVAL